MDLKQRIDDAKTRHDEEHEAGIRKDALGKLVAEAAQTFGDISGIVGEATYTRINDTGAYYPIILEDGRKVRLFYNERFDSFVIQCADTNTYITVCEALDYEDDEEMQQDRRDDLLLCLNEIT
jgi:hypothetical protein